MCIYLKEWTFLFYANGSNELEPETWQAVEKMIRAPIGTNLYVAVQISRESSRIVSLLRPERTTLSRCPAWEGVRRYCSDRKGDFSFHHLTGIHMADPASLSDFILWGMEQCPAKHYVLSISGHIYQFVGMCPDYSGHLPFMMGFPELSLAVQKAFEGQKADLDVLILDTCYASTVEILYELGRYEQPRIRQVLTYIGKGPLEGLPYVSLLSLLNQTAFEPIEVILNRFVNEIAVNPQLYGLIALRIDRELLKLIKELFSKLAAAYLLCKTESEAERSPEELLSNYRPDCPWSLYLMPLHRLLRTLIMAKRTAEFDHAGVLPIHVLYQKIPDEQRKKLYCRLSFSKENNWAALLCNVSPNVIPLESEQIFAPLPIPRNILPAFIHASNEQLSPEAQEKMLEELIERKHWDFL